MESKMRKIGVLLGAALAVVLPLLIFFWYWVVERVEVGPGEILIVSNLWGRDLPPGEIIAPPEDDSYKGILLEPKREGRHFINPLFQTYERSKLVTVRTDECLVLTRKYGTPISEKRLKDGDFLAGPGERGVVKDVLTQGNHALNPHAYGWEVVKAVEIKSDEVGVRTLKVGIDPNTLKKELRKSPYVVPDGCRGVQEKPVSAGTKYINPYVEEIVPVNVATHRVEFTDIEFPTKDGFRLKPHVKVAYKVEPTHAPELYVTLTNQGQLHQKDETPQDKEQNEILQKVVLPFIRGYVRIEGSKFEAHDFFTSGSEPTSKKENARELLAEKVSDKVKEDCQRIGIYIEPITLAQIDTKLSPNDPKGDVDELLTQIADRTRARNTRLKNIETIAQLKTQQGVKLAEALKLRETALGDARTELNQEQQRTEGAIMAQEAKLKQDLENAQLALEAAQADAKATLSRGKADAELIQKKNEAEVSGLKTAIQGFPSADQYAQYQVMSKLAPALTEIFASDTSEFAKLFAAYMTPPKKETTPTAPGGGGGPPPMEPAPR
jgi:regulator of protease activity HflC (stomatin/prohibitin superfamily)